MKWMAYYQEECRIIGERNQNANPIIPLTYSMLTGTGDQFATGEQQAALPPPPGLGQGGRFSGMEKIG